MRRQHIGLAVCLAAAAIAAAWVLTDTPEEAETVRVEAPAPGPAPGPPAWFTDATRPAAPLNIDELMRQATDNLTGRPLCDAPPIELTDEQKREVEKALSTAPIPPTVPPDTPGAVSNVHQRLMPC